MQTKNQATTLEFWRTGKS